jgi:hypothetical protein
MNEDRAAAPRHAWERIVVEFDDEIVEAVVPSQPITWFSGRPPKGLVIAAVRWVLAPGIVGPDPAQGEQGPGRRQAVGAPPQPDGVKPAGRRAAIAFALVGPHAAAAERDP